MKSVIIFCVLAFVAARPDKPYQTNELVRSADSREDYAKILRDDRIHPGEDGSYSFDFETEDGIVRSESGSKLDIEEEPVGQQGEFAFDLPNGERFELKFVANENGYQPESDWLPVAPEFPHPIPQFVLDQIEKAALEDAEAERSDSYKAPE